MNVLRGHHLHSANGPGKPLVLPLERSLGIDILFDTKVRLRDPRSGYQFRSPVLYRRNVPEAGV